MDKSLSILCSSLKQVIGQLKPQSKALSFLLLTGKSNQGKTALLRQSSLTHFPTGLDNPASLFYNQYGIILELGESWLNESQHLLSHTLKQLNRCHNSIKISGIILCIDSGELLQTEPMHLVEQCKSHSQLLERFGRALGYRVEASVMLTKLDSLAGFSEFFQSEHVNDLRKPLGFSLDFSLQKTKFMESYKQQFDQMLELLGQQIINKLHPARSTVKRTLIREFPLQLASLRVPIYSLLQHLPHAFFRIQTIYFSSAEQGGFSVDQLNKKIQHEYALVVQDKFPQSNNYKPYFIEEALNAILERSKRYIAPIHSYYKWLLGSTIGVSILAFIGIGYQHFKTSKLLDEASKELLTYEALITQPDDKTSALYHLSLANSKLALIPINLLTAPAVDALKNQLHDNAQHRLQDNFFPELLADIEHTISDPTQSPTARYQALKIYLMLAEPKYYSEKEVKGWFALQWKNQPQNKSMAKRLLLLDSALKQPMQPLVINQQLVSDARNYLNALPSTYLYYSFAKNNFSTVKYQIAVDGFDLAASELPVYYTKEGFREIMANLPKIAAQLQRENWVLKRQDLSNLPLVLEEAYCFEYVTWWQNFIKKTKPIRYQNYEQAQVLFQKIHNGNSFKKLTHLVQQQTSPEFDKLNNLFNQKIASQFTKLSLISDSATRGLNQNINELEKFLTTLSLIQDQNRTVFELTKSRFQGTNFSDPLSALYHRSQQLPEPLATWTKQLADDTWFVFINKSRDYLNQQWQDTVYRQYQATIANRYPLDATQTQEINLGDFDRFFSPHGLFNSFANNYLKPFIDTSQAEWQPKELNGYVLPINHEFLNELIRANVISNMFFPDGSETSKIEFSLQKINLDPVVASLQLTIGQKKLNDNQETDSFMNFTWPDPNAKLSLASIEGEHFELEEIGTWAFFKMLQKVNVLVDNNDSASLQILFEVNGNSGRYLLKTQNKINPFSPGILSGFNLKDQIV